ncbi:beta-1,6-galactofuranosyltransferase [Seonamhaeicola sp.]|uniref:beta-1,6-galactofuranosyltransferase n=1 Tax=Seonamhaeicola sp. TaxID=1912245 RepID=UPI002629CD0F|nr:beta-1,6-galactofuranosyltransferase [Seonamhaeicola sp.]
MYYISKNYKSLFSAAGKAKTDYEYVLNKMGFINLGFKQSSIPNSTIGAIKNFFGITLALIKLPFGAILCTQYPINKYRKYILLVAKIKRCKIITLIHDVRFLRGRTRDREKELTKLKKSDAIIVHNLVMKNWFLDHNIDRDIISLDLFDYISELRPDQNDHVTANGKYGIVYAGGMSGEKNSYLYDFDTLSNSNYYLNLYGKGFEEDQRKVDQKDSILTYHGALPSDKVAFSIKGHFGLVWDGPSTKTCTGRFGEYLRFNNPHKTSLYLLSGLPVIIWNEAALAPFIVDNNLGIGISNLETLEAVLSGLSKADYDKMKKSVIEFQDKVMSGYHAETATRKAAALLKGSMD